MSRGRKVLLCALLAASAMVRAQQLPPAEPNSLPPAEPNGLPPKESNSPPALDQLPPQEDKNKTDDEKYAFNPVKSKKAVEVGEFYMKKSDFKAAASRFIEATKWNDGNADAWLKLGEAEEKMNDLKATRAAWEKYLQLAPSAKNSGAIRTRIEKLK